MRIGLVAVLIIFGWLVSLPQRDGSRLQAQSSTDPSVQESNDRFVRQIMGRIAGREDEPAGQVFKNVQILAAVSARNLVEIMNTGYSRALGVNCTHCHVEDDFSSESKRPKRAAREMAAMHRSINAQLHGMKELKRPERSINCVMCHRGAVEPRNQ
jgi:hypothetical protein